ncbi:hypothetical protein [Mycobacterium simiae]|uniref:hypothetical protein n=1 Tax=Mycobacterium simiae TaxID=1784 RepID=UPI00111C6418|nr:hypothetical protein [Mycobacterium simiae]
MPVVVQCVLFAGSRQAFVGGVQAVGGGYRTGSHLIERDGNPRERQTLRNCGQDPDHADRGSRMAFVASYWAAWRFGGRSGGRTNGRGRSWCAILGLNQ